MKKTLAVLLILAPLSLIACKPQNVVESPPLMYLIASDGTLMDGFQGPYCWDSGKGAALCVDPIPPQFDETTTIPAGEAIRLQLDTPLPDTVSFDLRTDTFGDSAAEATMDVNPTMEWTPAAAPGQYVLVVSATWPQGDVSYWFSVVLE